MRRSASSRSDAMNQARPEYLHQGLVNLQGLTLLDISFAINNFLAGGELWTPVSFSVNSSTLELQWKTVEESRKIEWLAEIILSKTGKLSLDELFDTHCDVVEVSGTHPRDMLSVLRAVFSTPLVKERALFPFAIVQRAGACVFPLEDVRACGLTASLVHAEQNPEELAIRDHLFVLCSTVSGARVLEAASHAFLVRVEEKADV